MRITPTTALAALLLALFAAVSVSAAGARDVSIELPGWDEDKFAAHFDDIAGNEVPFIVAFTAPWCPHCRTLRPLFEDAQEAFGRSGEACEVWWVDATVEGLPAKKFGVKGYPTIFMLRDGVSYRYSGARYVAKLAEFCRTGAETSRPADLYPPSPIDPAYRAFFALNTIVDAWARDFQADHGLEMWHMMLIVAFGTSTSMFFAVGILYLLYCSCCWVCGRGFGGPSGFLGERAALESIGARATQASLDAGKGSQKGGRRVVQPRVSRDDEQLRARLVERDEKRSKWDKKNK